MNYDTRAIRNFVNDVFDDNELGYFCHDYFKEVYKNFTVGMTKKQKIQMLLIHCEQKDHMSKLLGHLRDERSRAYEHQIFFKPQTLTRTSRISKRTVQQNIQSTDNNRTISGWLHEMRTIVYILLLLVWKNLSGDPDLSEIIIYIIILFVLWLVGLLILRFFWLVDSFVRVNINESPVSNLIDQAKIAPTYAQKIIEHRENHGRFSSLKMAKSVPGLSSKTKAMIESKCKIEKYMPFSYSKYRKLFLNELLVKLSSK